MSLTCLESGRTEVLLLSYNPNQRKQHLTIGFHELLTSISLGDNDYFESGKSDIVNLFNVYGKGCSKLIHEMQGNTFKRFAMFFVTLLILTHVLLM